MAWVRHADRDNTASSGATAVSADLLQNYAADVGQDTVPGMVIERCIGDFWFASATIGAASGFMVSMIVTPEGGLVANPVLDTEIYRSLWTAGGIADGLAVESSASTFTRRFSTMHFDVKGRWRLVNVGDQLVMLVRPFTGEADLLWDIYSSVLVRIP